jgi:hypothetical protein
VSGVSLLQAPRLREILKKDGKRYERVTERDAARRARDFVEAWCWWWLLLSMEELLAHSEWQ